MNKRNSKRGTIIGIIIIFIAFIFTAAGGVVGYRFGTNVEKMRCDSKIFEEDSDPLNDFIINKIDGHVLPCYFDNTYRGDVLSDENLKLIYASSYINPSEITPNVNYQTGVYYSYVDTVKSYKDLFAREFNYASYPNDRMSHIYEVSFSSWVEDYTKEVNCDINNMENCYVSWNNTCQSTYIMKVDTVLDNKVNGHFQVHYYNSDQQTEKKRFFEMEINQFENQYYISKFTIK